MAVIAIPKVLREKLGEDGADSLVELINLANQKVKEDVIELSAEKFERRLSEELSKLRTEDIAKLDKRITDEVAKLRVEMADLKTDLIKWQIGMFVTTVILILGLYATIIFK